MKTRYRFTLIFIAFLLALVMFFGNRNVSEAQSAIFYFHWSANCAKGEPVTLKPKYDKAFDWTDPYTGAIEKIVPYTISCKTGTTSVSKLCKGFVYTRASRTDPMNKTHVSCYGVP